MKFSTRVKKELYTFQYRAKGYSRLTASRWYFKVKRDDRIYRDIYSAKELKAVHKRGYLAKNIDRYALFSNPNCDMITDLDYLSLRPYNNHFFKWIEDINTMNRRLPAFHDILPTMHFSVIPRKKRITFRYPDLYEHGYIQNILHFFRSHPGKYELRPAFWNSKGKRYNIEYTANGKLYVDDAPCSQKEFINLIYRLQKVYVIIDHIDYGYKFVPDWDKYYIIKSYIVNDNVDAEGTQILSAYISVFDDYQGKTSTHCLIDRTTGAFTFEGTQYTIPNWADIQSRLLEMGEELKAINYFSVSIALKEDGFVINNCNQSPFLPHVPFDAELNEYLKEKAAFKRAHPETFRQKYKRMVYSLQNKWIKKVARPGMRPYMYRLWLSAVKADLFEYKETSLKQKLWCWKRGFLSYRIEQYNLNENNYLDILSDYDYYWLNRINNVYQIWVNDKTTFRYVLDEFKDIIPEYYFSTIVRNGKTEYIRMPDCPADISVDGDGVLKLLEEKKKLVFKPSSGTHGDGFYCLEHDEKGYYINGKSATGKDIKDLITRQTSFYVITDYINMHHEIKEIYAKSVNSIRVMAINETGYDPKIMQTYIRIGSSKTGYTDNVGYGGICAMIDADGYIYQPEKIINHKFYPCERHPDTNTEIAGRRIPHWDMICDGIKRVCLSMPELEYLGFDIAVTEDGFNIIEINIHQDLHKVAEHSQEIKDFFKRKIEYKKSITK